MLGKFEFYWFFHGLMISEKNINKNNIKRLTRSCSEICRSSVFTKKTCALTEICCALLVFIFQILLGVGGIIKQIFHAFFCLILKLYSLSNIIFNSTLHINYLRWKISDIKQKGMEYLLNTVTRKSLFIVSVMIM